VPAMIKVVKNETGRMPYSVKRSREFVLDRFAIIDRFLARVYIFWGFVLRNLVSTAVEL
jgi:hypothetical protein